MKSIFEKVIQRGSYSLSKMLQRIDEYHIDGKLTDEEREELIAEARGDAKPEVNPTDEIQRLWAAIKKLTSRVEELEGVTGVDDIPDYSKPSGAHDAYFAGAVVRYNGKTYKCKAPDGVACVWSPDEMPGYWGAL